jgi:hypothetical protein
LGVLGILGIIVILVIGKFIYDTFLTNNTENNWNAYKRQNPHQASVLEQNKGLNIRSDNIRTDGYYVSRHIGQDPYGQNIEVTIIVIFNELGFAHYEDMEGHPEITNENVRPVLEELRHMNEDGLSRSFGKFKMDKSGAIDIIMYDPDHRANKDNLEPKNYQRLQGKVMSNGLILDIKSKHFNQGLGAYHEHTLIADIKFNFIEVLVR